MADGNEQPIIGPLDDAGLDAFACVYVTDAGFLACTCVSIATLQQAASRPVAVYLLHIDIEPADLAAARAYLDRTGARVTMMSLPSDELADLPRPQSLPAATYGRLLMHRVLPAHLSRVLYIDGDTLVDLDVTLLADIDLNGAVLGAVVDVGRILIGRRSEAQLRLDLGPDGDYFNAGVLLIDWPKWCAARIGAACLEALAHEPHRFTQKDQCALNYVCRGQWFQLDVGWNFQPASMTFDQRQRALFHFLGGRKPWQSGHIRHPMRFVARYDALLAASPWAREFKSPRVPYPVLDTLRLLKRGLSPRFWRNRPRYRRIS